MTKNKINIGMLTEPVGNAGMTPVLDLMNIFLSIDDCICHKFITGGEFSSYIGNNKETVIVNITPCNYPQVFVRIIKNYFYNQLKISFEILKTGKNVDLWFFFKGGEKFLFPMIISKLLNKKVVIIFSGSSVRSSRMTKGYLYSIPLQIISEINCKLADYLVLYSQNLITEWNLNKHRSKIIIASRHCINFNQFKITTNILDRQNIIGYVGRFSEEKGFSQFLHSIPLVLKRVNNVKFLIIGSDSPETTININLYLKEHNIQSQVEIIDWVARNELYKYLNLLKVIVLPSYTEGLPNTMLEAMACGTPVLATPVGSIPDIIIDGKTGFILRNNSPECIANNLIRVLKFKSIDDIVKNAKLLVENEFTYDKSLVKYSSIIQKIKGLV